jgi:hypothetical protein
MLFKMFHDIIVQPFKPCIFIRTRGKKAMDMESMF